MARTADNDEALDLKRRARRRLIGAVALVLFLVIVPPWVMDLEPKPVASNLSVEIPKQDGTPLKAPAPVAPVKPSDPAPASESPRSEAPKVEAPKADASKADASKADAPKADTARAEAPKADAAQAKAAPAEPPRKDKDAEAKRAEAILNAEKPDSYIIPLGAYASKDNVKQLQAKLSQAGIKSYTEPVKTASGEQTRVRVGPFASREAAEKAREKLKGMGEKPGAVIAR